MLPPLKPCPETFVASRLSDKDRKRFRKRLRDDLLAPIDPPATGHHYSWPKLEEIGFSHEC